MIKICEICGTDFEPYHNSRTCRDAGCQKELMIINRNKYLAKKRARTIKRQKLGLDVTIKFNLGSTFQKKVVKNHIMNVINDLEQTLATTHKDNKISYKIKQ